MGYLYVLSWYPEFFWCIKLVGCAKALRLVVNT